MIKRKKYHLLRMAKTQLNSPRLVGESRYVTWIGIDFIKHSTPYKLIYFALIPKRYLLILSSRWRVRSFHVGMLVLMWGASVTITFGSDGSRALRSLTTGRHLTHQRLATSRIATFSEIVSRRYAMAYDNVTHFSNLLINQFRPTYPSPASIQSFWWSPSGQFDIQDSTLLCCFQSCQVNTCHPPTDHLEKWNDQK